MDLTGDAIKFIVAHLAHVRAEYGEVLADADLVEPTGDFFPDEFKLEPEAIERLMRRMMTYAPLAADLDVALAFVEPEGQGSAPAERPGQGASAGGGCGSGACGTP